MTTSPCPNCHAPLEAHSVEGLYGRQLTIDLCLACQGIWFDQGESLQLSPHGTLALFRLIHERRPETRHAHGHRLDCPRCGLALSLVHDQQRTTRFQYFRCPRGHGRFITFFHFLRSRNFVRALTPGEVSRLRAQVKQVNCSNCGAPVDLEGHVACTFCGAPVSMLDPEQLQATLAELQAADARRRQVPPSLPLDLLMERLATEKVFAEANATGRSLQLGSISATSEGPVERGLDVLLKWFASSET